MLLLVVVVLTLASVECRHLQNVHSLPIAKNTPITTEKSIDFIAQTDDAPVNTLRGLSCVLGGALAHLAFGSFYCWGNFISYSPFSLRFFDGKYRSGVPPDSLIVRT
jgi:hypothetical protein